MGDIVSLEELAGIVSSGMKIAIPPDYSGVAMAATAAIIAGRPKDLHLVCVPASGVQADMMIGSGLIGVLETSAVTLGEAGGAPRFMEAVREGAFKMMDAHGSRTRRRVQDDGRDLSGRSFRHYRG